MVLCDNTDCLLKRGEGKATEEWGRVRSGVLYALFAEKCVSKRHNVLQLGYSGALRVVLEGTTWGTADIQVEVDYAGWPRFPGKQFSGVSETYSSIPCHD